MKNTNFTSLIIPVYSTDKDSVQMLYNCISSFKNTTIYPYEVIIIDDFSPFHNTRIYNEFSDIITKKIRNKRNLGYTKSVNKGIEWAKGNYIAIINSDIRAINWHRELIDVLQNKKVGIVFSEIQDRFHEVPFTGISGHFLITRRDIINKVGLWDERFKMFFGDLDFYNRVKYNGYKLICSPRTLILHGGHVTIDKVFLPNEILEIYQRDYKKYKKKYRTHSGIDFPELDTL